ncbi:unnamed protein product [Adineta ricciae]|uniref:DUF4440 domain-containing protein n=1 Tax=Adineta ricciae TaxID=249248 RepID=A0A815VZM1_ADIRI|nr:unnamed protein product [Adineta ricciae]CAF1551655.1 unnamed protein product [Adineta ricciae]
MASPIDIIKEKHRRMILLWNSKKLEDIVTTMCASDAYLSEYGILRKGHHQILNALETHYSTTYKSSTIELLSISDDCFVETIAFTLGDRVGFCHLTWKKIGDDWKITCGLWSCSCKAL